MKILNILMAASLILFASSSTYAQEYNLKRVVITWAGGFVDDTAIGPFSATGSMTLNGNELNQNITFCLQGSCAKVVDNGGGTIIDIANNTARITTRLRDGTLGDLTILTLYPNIITMFVYDDGTAETHEWEAVF